MITLRNQRAVVVFAVALFVVGATSCGDDEDDNGAQDTPDAAQNNGTSDTGDADIGDAEDAAPDTHRDADAEVDTGDVDGDVTPDVPEPVCEPLNCHDMLECEGDDCPVLSDYVQVVPGAGLPPQAPAQDANNNLDVVRHDGRVYFAWRTGPTHFASPDVVLHVVSSTDQLNWEYETSLSRDTDIREPRFLSWNGRLLLYYALLGESPQDFVPRGMEMIERNSDGSWTDPVVVYEEGVIPWRTKVIDGQPMMLAYEGGENIYDLNGEPILVYWLTTTDGLTWTPFVEGQQTMIEGGSSETDLVILDDGTIIAVARNEAGDERGWGMNICRAEATTPGDWQCINDPKKYDSPLLFTHQNDVWLVGRRNVSETGNYDLMTEDVDHARATATNLGDYSAKPKRCSLWSIDPSTLEVTFVLDLPSRGDTCFPGIVADEDNPSAYQIYNYSSPIDQEDLIWFNGQLEPTIIYRVTVEFP